MQGGVIKFKMGSHPNRNFGDKPEFRPFLLFQNKSTKINQMKSAYLFFRKSSIVLTLLFIALVPLTAQVEIYNQSQLRNICFKFKWRL